MSLRFATLLAVGLAATGCQPQGNRAPAVDASLARQSLRTALESWKRGEPPEALQRGSPSIVVQDMDWESGQRLVAFEIIGDGKNDDANLRCPVKLTLRDKQDREFKKNVQYVVGTAPVITVFRELFP